MSSTTKARRALVPARLLLVLILVLPLTVVALERTPLAAPSQAEVEAAKERLMELEREFELVVEEYNLVNDELATLQLEIGKSEIDVKQISARMGTREDAAIELARQLYMSGGKTGSIEAVVSSESFAEVGTRLAYLEESNQHQTEVFEGLAVDRQVLDTKISELEDAQAAALAKKEQLSSLRVTIEDKVESQRAEIERLNEAIARAEARERARELAAAAAAREAAARAAASGVYRGPIGVSADDIGAPPATNPQAQSAVDAALSQVGKPYQWAASGPDSYDCSGLTMWAWAQAGVSLPRNSAQQYAATPRVAREDLEPGDLVFFGSPIHHVGMYIGDGRMVEAPYTGQFVRVVAMDRSDYVGAGRP